MGTNYYWHDRPCSHCGRHDEIHVCKSRTIWRAYEHRLLHPEHPEWGHAVESPFGFELRTFAQWREILTTRPGELYDEYGVRIEDVAKWLDEVPAVERRSKSDGGEFLDPDGYRFFGGEFC